MRRGKKIALGILAALLLGGTALCVWQRENIGALYTVLTKDPESISSDMEKVRREHQLTLQEEKGVTVLQPSVEQSESLLNGTATAEEVKQALGLTDQLTEQPPSPGESAAPESVRPAEEKPVFDQTAALNRCVAELYAYKVDLTAQLGQLRQDTYLMWNNLPAGERTPARKQTVVMDGLYTCYALEAEADTRVKQILSDYRTLFENAGAGTEDLDELWVYYCEEKAAEKAYYMEKYLD